MKIIYITNSRLPTEKAHGYQIVKMCEEFAKAGCEVELIIPERENSIKEDVFLFYDLDENFNIKKIKSYDFLKFQNEKKIVFYLQSLFFILKLKKIKISKENVVYTRNPEIAYMFKLKGNKVIFEAHNWSNSKHKLYKMLIKKSDKIIAITKALKDVFSKNGISEKNILVAPDGVDLKKFDINLSKEDARNKLNLPQDKKIIMYTGNLLKWKGVDTLIETVALLKDDCLIYIVGGSENYFKEYEEKIKKYDNIKLVGIKPHYEIPIWLKAADVLILPNSGNEKISKKYTSPLKMFEYMASKRPIIASDLPSIREILNEKNAMLIKSDDEESLVDAIKKALDNKELCSNISERAFLDVQNYTWEKRAVSILNFIKND